jgi:predicted outer membrane protein
MNDGKQVRSLWIESEADGTENVPERVATPAAAVQRAPAEHRALKPSSEMSKDDWGRKDSAIHMMAAIKAAADALKHTIPSDPTPEDLTRFMERCKTLSYSWWQRADAVRKGDDSDIPFDLSEHDQAIGYPE